MPDTLTDTQRAAFIEFLEWAERNGIESGWFFGIPTPSPEPEVWLRPRGRLYEYDHIETATTYDYNMACGVMGRWLWYTHEVIVTPNGAGRWIYYNPVFGLSRETEAIITCPDDELAATLAAAKEISDA